ncbi:MAG TPA: ATP-binding cassette domain-containing protein [Leptospiraceae bacterium]|nr:ATP-binding cassette domain-containing protein [Leptospiraceae bacterium]HMW05695.1 ATP-binding cassette domain-containing protein [Leptospiraceae bacterium]HMX35072.1 ATP-binding cassette domain-containing protein [Leptospiraceae bacterium]HMY30272.1 ATP-binding cassette domain-containing protein [Leptospiraceae bacterium]HMZ66395.1 ATP-binding cassette domain-containing protein [Leptospiraceae bacterium]
MKNLLEIENLSVKIKNNLILKNINIILESEKITGLIGGSGSGKTTLIKTLLSIHNLEQVEMSGTIKIEGLKMNSKNQKWIQPVFQDPNHYFNPNWNLRQCLEEPLVLNQTVPKEKHREKILSYLNEFSISSDLLEQQITKFSGGELQRISIIRAILSEPKILLMDEPVSGLDPLIQRDAITLIQRLNKEKKITLLLISHDIDFISELCDFIYVIQEGQIVEANSCYNILNDPKSEYTKLILNSRNLENIKN